MVKINWDLCYSDPFVALKLLAAISATIVSLTGIWIIVFGLNRYDNFWAMAEATGQKYVMISLLVVIVGLLTTIVALVGLIAILTMGYSSLMGYFYMVLFTFLLQGVFGGYMLIDGSDPCEIQKSISSSMETYLQNSTNPMPLTFMERTLHCCGVNSPNEYLYHNYSVLTTGPHKSLPISCCIKYSYCSVTDNNHWNTGCKYEVIESAFTSMHDMGTLVVSSSTVSVMSAAIVYVHALQAQRVYL